MIKANIFINYEIKNNKKNNKKGSNVTSTEKQIFAGHLGQMCP